MLSERGRSIPAGPSIHRAGFSSLCLRADALIHFCSHKGSARKNVYTSTNLRAVQKGPFTQSRRPTTSSESQYAILERTPNGSADFAKPARGATCREPRPRASSSHLSDFDCHGLGVAFCLADPTRSPLGDAVRGADSGSCRYAFHLVDQNIRRSGHAGARESTHYHHRQGRAVPLQSQPHLSRVLTVSDGTRARSQRRLALGHAAPGDFCDVVRRHTSRGALPRSVLRRRIREVQGKRPALVVG